MKVIVSKREKAKQYDQKSDQTTDINSGTHSRRNSSFLGLSKGSQSFMLPAQKIIFGPETKRNKRCLNVTINNNKITEPKTLRSNHQQRKSSFLNFNFCQQVSNKENFYTQIVDVENVQQVFNQPQKVNNKKSLRAISLGKTNSTLNSPNSPINQLVKLLDQSQDDLAVELQNMLERL